MAIKFDWNDITARLVIEASGSHQSFELEEILRAVEDALGKGMQQMLVIHEKADVEYDTEIGFDFADKLGAVIGNNPVKIAVVKGVGFVETQVIDSTLFSMGFQLAQFERKKGALHWLDSEA